MVTLTDAVNSRQRIQMLDKVRKNSALTMWNKTRTVRITPAIQCGSTHAKLTPITGRNPVNSSTSMQAAINQ